MCYIIEAMRNIINIVYSTVGFAGFTSLGFVLLEVGHGGGVSTLSPTLQDPKFLGVLQASGSSDLLATYC